MFVARWCVVLLACLQPGTTQEPRAAQVAPAPVAHGPASPGSGKAFAPFVAPDQIAACTDGDDALLTTVFALQHANAQEAANLLQSYFCDPMNESVRAAPQSNCVVVTGRLRGLRVTQRMLASIDVAPSDPFVSEVVHLRFAVASEIGDTLATWAKGLPPGAAMLARLGVVAYQERNAIIVSGPRSLVDQTKALVTLLDVEVK